MSCANPALGPGMGVVGIGVASAMAGQAAVHCRHYFKTGQHPLSTPSAASFQSRDILLDAAMGIILYKVHMHLLLVVLAGQHISAAMMGVQATIL